MAGRGWRREHVGSGGSAFCLDVQSAVQEKHNKRPMKLGRDKGIIKVIITARGGETLDVTWGQGGRGAGRQPDTLDRALFPRASRDTL